MRTANPKLQDVLKILSSSKVALSATEVATLYVRIYPPSNPHSSQEYIEKLKPVFQHKLKVCHTGGFANSQFMMRGEMEILEEVFQITAAGTQFLSTRH